MTPPTRLVDPLELAATLGVTRGFVYEHADELGVIRLGSGPKARQRYDVAIALERLTACTSGKGSNDTQVPSPVLLRRAPRRAIGTNVELLPIGGVRQRSDVL